MAGDTRAWQGVAPVTCFIFFKIKMIILTLGQTVKD
jgi:hypothetical protein